MLSNDNPQPACTTGTSSPATSWPTRTASLRWGGWRTGPGPTGPRRPLAGRRDGPPPRASQPRGRLRKRCTAAARRARARVDLQQRRPPPLGPWTAWAASKTPPPAPPPQICDFGLARPAFADDEALSAVVWTDYVATRWYRAPELCGSFYARYSPAIDTWSVGCIFAEVRRVCVCVCWGRPRSVGCIFGEVRARGAAWSGGARGKKGGRAPPRPGPGPSWAPRSQAPRPDSRPGPVPARAAGRAGGGRAAAARGGGGEGRRRGPLARRRSANCERSWRAPLPGGASSARPGAAAPLQTVPAPRAPPPSPSRPPHHNAPQRRRAAAAPPHQVLLNKPLFPGKSVVHQLELITDCLGTPTPEVVAKVGGEGAGRGGQVRRRNRRKGCC